MGTGHANRVPALSALSAASWLGILILCPASSGCDTVDLGNPPADVNACRPSQRFFYERVWPEFLSKDYGGKHCSDSRCHDVASPVPMRLPPPTSVPMVPLPPDWAAIYVSASEQLSCTSPSTSNLILRPSSASHGGGMLITPGGDETALIQMWVSAPP